MKFEYEKEDDLGKVVAYLHTSGGLLFNITDAFSSNGELQGAASIGGKYSDTDCITLNGSARLHDVIENDNLQGKKFYRGDKITITF